MAGDWIAMRHDLAEDPAVMDMALILGCDELVIVGRLYAVWRWFDEQTTDGHALSVTGVTLDRRVDRFARHEGFAEAMRKVGWLDDNGLPRFDTWMSKSAKTRLLAARRKRAERSRSERDENATRGEERRGENNKKPTLRVGSKGTRTQKAAKWRKVPAEEQLTEERLSRAVAEGLSDEQARREWRKFTSFEFRRGHSDVDGTWLNWAIEAVDRLGRSPFHNQKSLAEQALELAAQERAANGRNG